MDRILKDSILSCNAYLSSNINYDIAKEKIKYITPKFICADILDIDDNIKYDNIWLSNIATRIRNMDVVLKND